jgi:methylmalonyl-CoA mutase
MYYEHLKHTGELPIIGVNTFQNPSGEYEVGDLELSRATEEEKQSQLTRLNSFIEGNREESTRALKRLKDTVLSGGNIFAELMDTVRYCSIGQITGALYEVGGKYRRNM